MFYIWFYREIHLSPASPTISRECCAVAAFLPNCLVLLDLASMPFKTSHRAFEMTQSIHVAPHLRTAVPSPSSDETRPIVVRIVNA